MSAGVSVVVPITLVYTHILICSSYLAGVTIATTFYGSLARRTCDQFAILFFYLTPPLIGCHLNHSLHTPKPNRQVEGIVISQSEA